jgi:hypothetical protein
MLIVWCKYSLNLQHTFKLVIQMYCRAFLVGACYPAAQSLVVIDGVKPVTELDSLREAAKKAAYRTCVADLSTGV